jgi:hypothetical protein
MRNALGHQLSLTLGATVQNLRRLYPAILTYVSHIYGILASGANAQSLVVAVLKIGLSDANLHRKIPTEMMLCRSAAQNQRLPQLATYIPATLARPKTTVLDTATAEQTALVNVYRASVAISVSIRPLSATGCRQRRVTVVRAF